MQGIVWNWSFGYASTMETQRPLAVITGASAGIGIDLAREAAADGFDTLLIARRADRLAAVGETLPTTTNVMALDLAEPGAGAAVVRHLSDLGRRADVLVNNAGFGTTGAFAEADGAQQTKMVDLNVRAVVDLSHALLPGMLERNNGGILNVASTAAFLPGPGSAVYYATKAFVLSFSEALTQECAGTNVRVTALCPGPTKSEFAERSGMDRRRLFKMARLMSSETVARTGWRAFRNGKRVIITGNSNRLSAAGGKLMPHRLLLPVVAYLQNEG